MTAPFTPKPSILDRVLGRLIPTNQYGDVLSPTETKAIRSQGLIGLGTGILAQGGPGTGPLQAFGRAYQGLDMPGMATHALKLQQYRKAVTDQAAYEQASASVQRQPGESDYEYIARKAAATAGMPGAPDKLASLLDALKQPERQPRNPFTQVVDLHEEGTWLVDKGTGAKIVKLGPGTIPGEAAANTAAKKPPTLAERKAAGESFAASSADSELRGIENSKPQTLAEVARFVALPSVGRLVPWSGAGIEGVIRQARSAGLSDDAQTYIKRLYDFASLAGPSRYGRNFRSEVLLQQIWSDFGAGQLGVSGGGITATQKNRENAVGILRATGGEKARKVVSPLFPSGTPAPSGTRGTYSPDNPYATPPDTSATGAEEE